MGLGPWEDHKEIEAAWWMGRGQHGGGEDEDDSGGRARRPQTALAPAPAAAVAAAQICNDSDKGTEIGVSTLSIKKAMARVLSVTFCLLSWPCL